MKEKGRVSEDGRKGREGREDGWKASREKGRKQEGKEQRARESVKGTIHERKKINKLLFKIKQIF